MTDSFDSEKHGKACREKDSRCFEENCEQKIEENGIEKNGGTIWEDNILNRQEYSVNCTDFLALTSTKKEQNDDSHLNTPIKGRRTAKKKEHANVYPSPPPKSAPPYRTWQNGAKGIRNCLRKHTYVWQNNGMDYWFHPLQLQEESIAGLIWSRQRWSPHTVLYRAIRSHQCVGCGKK